MSVGTQTNFLTGTITIQDATTPLITNLSMPLANTEYSHGLQANLKQVIIRCRGKANVNLAFTALGSGTLYFTIPKNTCLELSKIDFSSKMLYVQCDIASQVLEIIEFF